MFAVKEYIADCANILLSIGIEYGLYREDSIKSDKESILLKNCIQIKTIGETEIRQLL